MSIRTYFENIADAIREKGGTTDTLTPAEMPQAILDLPSGGGGFVENEYSEYLNGAIDLGVNINTSYTVECSFYANAYQNDGHIIGSPTNSSGAAYHLTTYANKWYASNGNGEFNFNADSTNYPLYGKDIIYRLTQDGKLYLNGINAATGRMGTTGDRYGLNTRGGGATQGKYKYKYFKIWNSNNELIHHFVFGTMLEGTIKMIWDKVTDTYLSYN